MSSSFSFPPPPPPPRKASASVYEGAAVSYPQNDAQYGRGGRGGQGNHRGRGRGNVQLTQRGGSYARGGYSDGGARFAAQTPMTGVSGPQQYPTQLPTDSNRGYAMPQYPQWQPTPAPAPFQYSSSQYPYSQSTAAPIPYPSQNMQNQYNRPGPPVNGYNVQLPGFNANRYMPQPWPLPVARFNHTQQTMGPPIRIGFGSDHAQNVGRDVYKTRGHLSSARHNGPNQYAGNKRRREDTDMNQISVNGQTKRPKTQVAPVVPSFGPQLPNTPAPASVAPVAGNDQGQSKSKRNKKKRNFNLLGLTPRTEEHEDSEPEDVDEEAAFVDQGQTLQFEYRGRTSTLGSSSDIAAWIEQRRQRWPTKERVEQKKQAGAQRAQEQQDLRRKAHESQRKERQQERKQKTQKNDDEQGRKSLQKHLKKAERLRRELEKSEKKAAAAIAANEGTEDMESSDSISISSSSAESSSDSDDTTDDDVPEEASSKGKALIKVPPPERKSRRICKYFLTNGRCRLGARCSFRHELPERGNKQFKRETKEKKVEQQKPKRLSLHERFVEQEKRAENELALQAIKYLGRDGFFEHIPEDDMSAGLPTVVKEKGSVDSPADSSLSVDAIQLSDNVAAEGNPQLKQQGPRKPDSPQWVVLQQQGETNDSPATLNPELSPRQEVHYFHKQDFTGPMSESSSETLHDHTEDTRLSADGPFQANGNQESQQTERKEKTVSEADDNLYTDQHRLDSTMPSTNTRLHNEPPPEAQDFRLT